MEFKDYYKILGISKNATAEEIKKAYRKLARKYHPDLNQHDKAAEKKFKEINEANEVLSHPENRKKYDQYGKDWKHAEEFEKARRQHQGSRGQQKTYSNYSGAEFSEKDFSDFFESMFGQGHTHRKSPRYRGQDYHAELQLNLEDVYSTHKRVLSVHGKKIRLTIPAGVENKQVIRIKGHGEKGINGGPNGDLYIKFDIVNNTPFKRNKTNLHLTVDLDLYTAILGGEITVSTLGGKVKLKVNPETQNGTKVKLKGKGFPVYKKEGRFGDLYLTYQIKIPTNLTNREKDLFLELSKLR